MIPADSAYQWMAAFILASAILFSCSPSGTEDFAQTTRSLSSMNRQERNDIVRLLYAEAARYDKRFWQAPKSDLIYYVLGQVQQNEEGIDIIYDDQNRPRIVKSGRRKVVLTIPGTPSENR